MKKIGGLFLIDLLKSRCNFSFSTCMAAHLWVFGIFWRLQYRRFNSTMDTDKLTRQLNAGLEAIGTERFGGFECQKGPNYVYNFQCSQKNKMYNARNSFEQRTNEPLPSNGDPY